MPLLLLMSQPVKGTIARIKLNRLTVASPLSMPAKVLNRRIPSRISMETEFASFATIGHNSPYK
jgi:DNA-binding XRE family transcriptional regulator